MTPPLPSRVLSLVSPARGLLEAATDEDDRLHREVSPGAGDLPRLLRGAYHARVAVRVESGGPGRSLSLVPRGGVSLSLGWLGPADRALLVELVPRLADADGVRAGDLRALVYAALRGRVDVVFRTDLAPIE